MNHLGAALAIAIACIIAVSGPALTAEPEKGREAPRITEVDVIGPTPTSAQITWTVTVPATGQVEYGTSTDYGTFSTLEESFDYSTHVQQLAGLVPDTTYHFRVLSSTEDGFRLTSDDQTFSTPASAQPRATARPAPPAIYGPRPAPAAPGRHETVPSSIDAEGHSDVGPALQEWIDEQPDGSFLVFPEGATYRLEEGIRLGPDRRNLTLYGYGATLEMTGCGDSHRQSGFLLEGARDIRILGFRIVGSNDRAGTTEAYVAGCGEWSMGVGLYGGARDIEIADMDISRTHGDAIYVACWGPDATAGGYEFHHNLLELTGRQLVTINQGSDIQIFRNVLRSPALFAVDSEDCRSTGAILQGVSVTDNWFDTWNWHYSPDGQEPGDDYYRCQAVSIIYDEGQIGWIADISVVDNQLIGGCAGWGSASAGLCDPGGATVWMSGTARKTNVVVTGNRIDVPQEQRCGDFLDLEAVKDGLVSGNEAPGQTVRCEGCARVDIDHVP